MIIRMANEQVLEPPYYLNKPGIMEEEFRSLAKGESHAELSDGVMVVHSEPPDEHERIVGFIESLIQPFAEEQKVGLFERRFAMRPERGTVLKPDLLMVSERLEEARTLGYVDGVAGSVFEVITEGTRTYDLRDKREIYKDFRVGEIWIVDMAKMELHYDRRRGDGYDTERVAEGRVRSATIEDFWIEAAWLWEAQLPNLEDCLGRIRTSASPPTERPAFDDM